LETENKGKKTVTKHILSVW